MRIAVVGSGAIGASWAALFAAKGHDVVAADPSQRTLDALPSAVLEAWESLERLGAVADGATPDRIASTTSSRTAVDGAEFVQENAIERVDVKRELYAEMDEIAQPGVVLASSSSGIKASDIQTACAHHPERVLIGHPFNPPHLVPLVEVVGGSATSDDAIDTAMNLYIDIGKTPIRIRAELPGHVTNRLQAALWREAYWLVEQGVVSVAEVDAAISNGPGLRWALLGPFATQHFSGGPGGMAHVMEHLGPPMAEWWDTMRTPSWGDELIGRVVDGVEQELGAYDEADVRVTRDHLLEELLRSKSAVRDHLPTAEPGTPTTKEHR